MRISVLGAGAEPEMYPQNVERSRSRQFYAECGAGAEPEPGCDGAAHL